MMRNGDVLRDLARDAREMASQGGTNPEAMRNYAAYLEVIALAADSACMPEVEILKRLVKH